MSSHRRRKRRVTSFCHNMGSCVCISRHRMHCERSVNLVWLTCIPYFYRKYKVYTRWLWQHAFISLDYFSSFQKGSYTTISKYHNITQKEVPDDRTSCAKNSAVIRQVKKMIQQTWSIFAFICTTASHISFYCRFIASNFCQFLCSILLYL